VRDEDLLVEPELDGVPEDDGAEPADAGTDHDAPVEAIERLIAEDEG
jgi:hypothetical protein